VPIVVLTGTDDEDLAMRAVREGAQDYLVKGQVTGPLLVRAVRYATERKRAVVALQRSEEYFRSIIENALDIVAVLDPDGRVRYRSPSFEKTLGYPQGSLSGTDIFDVVHPDDQPDLREMLQSGVRHPGAVSSFEIRLLQRTGAWRVFECIGRSFEPDSAVGGFVLNGRDITERKRAGEQVRQANETLRAVIEASPLAIYTLSPGGTVLSWNGAAERMFGYSEREVIGRMLPIVAADTRDAFLARIENTTSGRLAAGQEMVLRHKDGQPMDVSVWNSLMRDSAGKVTGIVEAIADNSERKRLEEQVRHAQKMEAVGRLAGGVAHDFNNLLTVITGYCQMILDGLDPSTAMAQDLEQVLKAADRATTLTRQLLAFSRRQMVQPKVLEGDTLVREMLPMVKRVAGETIHLDLKLCAPDARIRVDPGNFEQVVMNLVANARDAMPNGGTIALETRTVDMDPGSPYSSFLPVEYFVLEVTDTGTGMSEETLRHLFEPFFTTKERGRGTGLGLSTSYGIVKQNQGEILVRSRLGVGSTFTIYLPTVAEELDTLQPAQRAGKQFRGKETVLLAEDEDGVRKVVVEMLRGQGYRVLAASGGAEALKIVETSGAAIDLLVTDVVMPGMTGKELADALRARIPGFPVLFVSGYTETGIVHEGIVEPGTDFLQKPFTPDELARKVRAVLDRGVRQESV
jgi:two-component system, cell cycle sensor histidine kinase and response regulator CckA